MLRDVENGGPNWSELSVEKAICTALNAAGFATPADVQQRCVPTFLRRRDVACEAATGSGKTLAFLVPILANLKRLALSADLTVSKEFVGKIFALVIAPTRELARQIISVFRILLEQLKSVSPALVESINALTMIGGHPLSQDVARFSHEKVNLIFSTPGRLQHFLKQTPSASTFDLTSLLKRVEYLVLDEADRLLDMGFEEQLKLVLSALPKQRTTGLFSATLSDGVTDLVRYGLREPIFIRCSTEQASSGRVATVEQAADLGPAEIPTTLHNFYAVVPFDRKFSVLVHFIKRALDAGSGKALRFLLFFNSCAEVEYFGQALRCFLGTDTESGGVKKRQSKKGRLKPVKGVRILLAHGRMKDKKRQATFRRFTSDGDPSLMFSRVLVTTDLMSRGVDIPRVDWVLQFSAPNAMRMFVHRCGRTARNGMTGRTLLLLMPNETSYVRLINSDKNTRLVQLPDATSLVDSAEDVTEKLRSLTRSDRQFLERSGRAFVSFLQSYGQNECSVVFRTSELNIGLLAKCYGLFKLPAISCIRGLPTGDFDAPDLDIKTVPFRDKQQELDKTAKVQKSIEQRKEKTAQKKERKARLAAEHKAAQKSALKALNLKLSKRTLKRKRAVLSAQIDDAEFAEDFRIMKKLKRRKVSENELNKAFGLC